MVPHEKIIFIGKANNNRRNFTCQQEELKLTYLPPLSKPAAAIVPHNNKHNPVTTAVAIATS